MTAHAPRVTLTEAEREAIWAGLRRARHEEAPIPLAHEFHKTHVLWAVGPAIEWIIAARLAPIRALVDAEPVCDLHGSKVANGCEECSVADGVRNYDRALLAALEASVSASQDHDGAEGQGEGEKAGGGEILPLPVAFREMAEKVPDSHLDAVTWGIAMEVAARICEEAR